MAACAILPGRLLAVASLALMPATRGPSDVRGFAALQRVRLSTDSIGTTTVTFAGVRAGSEIRVYLPDATEVAGVESCDADHVLTWGVYAPGAANNDVRVVIVNTAYKIKEFTYTASQGAMTLPVQQEPDPWYSNPA